jgi:hypothetical protein
VQIGSQSPHRTPDFNPCGFNILLKCYRNREQNGAKSHMPRAIFPKMETFWARAASEFHESAGGSIERAGSENHWIARAAIQARYDEMFRAGSNWS